MSNQRRPLGEISNTRRTNQNVLKRPSPTSPQSHRRNSNCVSPEYVEAIHVHLRTKETPIASYMSRQPHVDEKRRATIVDWLVNVHGIFELSPETLHLSVHIIDRFLTSKAVTLSKLKLLGVVALFISSKYEDVCPPEVDELIHISAYTYTRREILHMERLVLITLKYCLTVPTVHPFICRGLQLLESNSTAIHLTNYLGELSLLDSKVRSYLPSTIAAACLLLARQLFQVSYAWNKTLKHFVQLRLSEVEPCAQDLLDLVKSIPTCIGQTMFQKYSLPQYGKVALIAMDLSLKATIPTNLHGGRVPMALDH